MTAAGTAFALTPTANPVSDAAYQASIAITRALSSTLRGIANASAPKSAPASARSASEKLDAITPVRCDVAKSTTGMAQAKGRLPRRAASSAAPLITMPAYTGPVRLTHASESPRDAENGTMNQVATTPADIGYHACIVNACAGVTAAIARSCSHSAGYTMWYV